MYDSIGIPISPNSCMSTEYRQLKAIVRHKFVTLYSLQLIKMHHTLLRDLPAF